MQGAELAVLERIRDLLDFVVGFQAWPGSWLFGSGLFLAHLTIDHLAMAPRRPDRITRSGAPRNTPVSISVSWSTVARGSQLPVVFLMV